MKKILDLSSKKKIKDATFWNSDINQTYHPTGVFKSESFDTVYASDVLGKTKFTPILLKEWFWLLKKDGLLIIDYKPSKHIDFQKLEDNMWWLWRKKYEIVFHGIIENNQRNNISAFITSTENYDKPKDKNGYLRFICRKKISTTTANDYINKWTFGIITNGQRAEWIQQIVHSIKKQRIPNYEIIVCGKLLQPLDKGIIYIPFDERSNKGWITKKKNLIVDKAKYNNLCILHDRILLNHDWYKGMKQWGNSFEHLACPQYYQRKRTNDWLIHEQLPGIEFSFVSHLDFKDWDFNACQGGQMHIVKKNIIMERYWNETYMWGRPEDVELTNALRDMGYIIRCNPYASFETLLYKFGNLPNVPFNDQYLSTNREGDMKRIFSRWIYAKVYKNSLIRKFFLKNFHHLTKS